MYIARGGPDIFAAFKAGGSLQLLLLFPFPLASQSLQHSLGAGHGRTSGHHQVRPCRHAERCNENLENFKVVFSSLDFYWGFFCTLWKKLRSEKTHVFPISGQKLLILTNTEKYVEFCIFCTAHWILETQEFEFPANTVFANNSIHINLIVTF